jgi:putative MATE family efflux protein
MISSDLLLSAPPQRLLVRLSGLIFVNLALASSITLVDAYLIGHLGSDALGAFAFVLPATALLYGLGSCLGTGARTAIATCIGRGEPNTAAHTCADTCLSTLPIFGLLGAAMALVDGPCLSALGARPALRQMAELYLLPIWCMAPSVAIWFVMNSALQAAGDLRAALQLTVVPVIVNVVLACLLIRGAGPIPALGMLGAGLATAGAWTCSAFAGACLLTTRRLLLRPASLIALRKTLTPVYQVAIPASIGGLLQPVAVAVLTALVATMGTLPLAAFGIVSRVATFIVMGASAIGASIHVVAGAANGSDNQVRVRQTIVTGMLMALSWGAAWTAGLAIAARGIGRVFTAEPHVVALIEEYIHWGCGGLAFICASLAAGAGLNAVSRAGQALLLTLATTWLVNLPILYVASRHAAWTGLSVGSTIAQAGVLAVYVLLFRSRGLVAWQVSAGTRQLG